MLIPYLLLSALPPEEGASGERLLPHLDRLFSLAQSLTMDTDRAVRLVEETYRRAYAAPPEGAAPEEVRRALYGLLLAVHAEDRTADGADLEAAGSDLPVPESTPAASRAWDDFRRRLAGEFVEKALPAAFASLTTEHRLLLTLCEVDGLASSDAADLAGLAPETARVELENARRALHEALDANATQVERGLLAHSLPAGWERPALTRMVNSEFAPPPPAERFLPPRTAPEDAATDEASAAEAHPDSPPRDEPDAAEAPGRPWLNLARQVVATLMIIAIAGALGYGFNALMQPRAAVTNVVTLSVEQTDEVDVGFPTNSLEQAEKYVLSELSWRITLPEISQATFDGAGIHEVADGIRVPVFRYQDAATLDAITIYAYTYALLDRHGDRLELARDILRQIEDDDHFDLYDMGERKVLVWRHRDDIFVAVTTGSVEDLRERILFPS